VLAVTTITNGVCCHCDLGHRVARSPFLPARLQTVAEHDTSQSSVVLSIPMPGN